MVIHWDDTPGRHFRHGDMRAERWRLGSAAGARDIGCSRYRIQPGDRSMPLHVHADEEEIFFVLEGSGLLWQGDAVHEIAARDAIVHRAGEEPHTLIAGDEPLEVLAFGTGSRTRLTWLPRAGVMWAGPHWLPLDAEHPFAAEAAAGTPHLPPVAPRPANVVALRDVPGDTSGGGRVRRVRRDLGRAGGSARSGLKHIAVEPGARASTRHCHSVEEELFVALGGSGTAILGDPGAEGFGSAPGTGARPVRRGSVVARPPGTGVAHTFEAGDDGLELLAYGTREDADVCWYPDSRKVYWRGIGVMARVQQVGYWDGEA